MHEQTPREDSRKLRLLAAGNPEKGAVTRGPNQAHRQQPLPASDQEQY